MYAGDEFYEEMTDQDAESRWLEAQQAKRERAAQKAAREARYEADLDAHHEKLHYRYSEAV